MARESVCWPGLVAMVVLFYPLSGGAQGHLQYFGFALVDCGWDDPHDGEHITNYTAEVSAFSNIAQLCLLLPELEIRQRVLQLNAAGKLRGITDHQSQFDQIGSIWWQTCESDDGGCMCGFQCQ